MKRETISFSPAGKMVIHARGDNAAAYENGKRKDEEFKLALLDTVFAYQQSKQSGILSIENCCSTFTGTTKVQIG